MLPQCEYAELLKDVTDHGHMIGSFDGKETAESRLHFGTTLPLYSGTTLPLLPCARPRDNHSVRSAQDTDKALTQLSYPDSLAPPFSVPATKRHTAENKAKRKRKEQEADAELFKFVADRGDIIGSFDGKFGHALTLYIRTTLEAMGTHASQIPAVQTANISPIATPKMTCKKCNAPPLLSNYGFCGAHRGK